MIRTCIILVAAALCNAEGGKYTREANQPVSYHGMLGWGCLFFGALYPQPNTKSCRIVLFFCYLLSTPMGRDGNPRGKIQPALYQPGHLLAKHHFSSKREACYHKLRSTYFTLRYFFFSPTSTTLTIQLVVTGTLPHLYNATARMNAGHDRHWSSNGDTADCRWRGEFQHKHTL